MLLIALAVATSSLVVGCGASNKKSKNPTKFTRSPFNVAKFVDPRLGGNRWFPLKPGMQFVRKGTTLIGNRAVPHAVVTTVTDVIRTINGVKAVLVYDHSEGAGQVVQQSLDYFAQEKGGAIWYLGSTTEQYEAGRFVAVDEAWLASAKGAKAGILMPANPTAATPPWTIAQPSGEKGDAAEFARMQPKQCVPYDCFTNVLVVREGKKTALDNELKYYADGVGQIRNEPRSDSRHDDIEWLTNVTRLSSAGLAEASKEAMRIDAEAAKTFPKIYGTTKATRA